MDIDIELNPSPSRSPSSGISPSPANNQSNHNISPRPNTSVTATTSSKPTGPSPPSPPLPSTPQSRIHELTTQIDATVPLLLTSASHAIRALATPTPTTSLEQQKSQFSTHTTAFYTHIQSLSAHLRRQAYALEEAGIIASEASTSTSTSASAADTTKAVPPGASNGAAGRGGAATLPPTRSGIPPGAPGITGLEQGQGGITEPVMQLTNGGLGGLDVGWLNSRRDGVGKRKEAELWKEMRRILEGYVGGGDEAAVSGAKDFDGNGNGGGEIAGNEEDTGLREVDAKVQMDVKEDDQDDKDEMEDVVVPDARG